MAWGPSLASGAHKPRRHDPRADPPPQQLLHLVFGGELERLDRDVFKNLDALDIVGIYPSYASAYAAWKAKAQQTVDNAQMRYFIVHMHRLLHPDEPGARRR